MMALISSIGRIVFLYMIHFKLMYDLVYVIFKQWLTLDKSTLKAVTSHTYCGEGKVQTEMFFVAHLKTKYRL